MAEAVHGPDGPEKLNSRESRKLHIQKNGDQAFAAELFVHQIRERLPTVRDDLHLRVHIGLFKLPHEQRFIVGVVLHDQDFSG